MNSEILQLHREFGRWSWTGNAFRNPGVFGRDHKRESGYAGNQFLASRFWRFWRRILDPKCGPLPGTRIGTLTTTFPRKRLLEGQELGPVLGPEKTSGNWRQIGRFPEISGLPSGLFCITPAKNPNSEAKTHSCVMPLGI